MDKLKPIEGNISLPIKEKKNTSEDINRFYDLKKEMDKIDQLLDSIPLTKENEEKFKILENIIIIVKN